MTVNKKKAKKKTAKKKAKKKTSKKKKTKKKSRSKTESEEKEEEPRGIGRPAKYTRTLAEEICIRLANGEPMTKICRSDQELLQEALAMGNENPVLPVNSIPDYSTVMRWLLAVDKEGEAKYPEFRVMYEEARDIQADHMADKLVDISDEDPVLYNKETGRPVMAFGSPVRKFSASDQKNRIDARKWIAAKLKPRKYGDRLIKELSGPGGGPIPTRQEGEKELFDRLLKNPKTAEAAEVIIGALEDEEDTK